MENEMDLKFGDKLGSGASATVIQFTNLSDKGNAGVALCILPNHRMGGTRDEFVTWHAYRDRDGKWHAEIGHYYLDFFEAVENYKNRGGK